MLIMVYLFDEIVTTIKKIEINSKLQEHKGGRYKTIYTVLFYFFKKCVCAHICISACPCVRHLVHTQKQHKPSTGVPSVGGDTHFNNGFSGYIRGSCMGQWCPRDLGFAGQWKG